MENQENIFFQVKITILQNHAQKRDYFSFLEIAWNKIKNDGIENLKLRNSWVQFRINYTGSDYINSYPLLPLSNQLSLRKISIMIAKKT